MNILLSSAGRRGELVKLLQESIAEAGFVGDVRCVDRSVLTAAGWISDGLDLVPAIRDEAFIPAVLEVCRRHGIRHVIPTLDPELGPYARAREQFAAEGVTVWVSSPAAVEIAQSKRLTNRWLRDSGLPAVRQWDLADFDLAEPFDVIAKPAGGSSSIGLVRIGSRAEAAALDPRLDYVVEEVAPGVEFTVDVLVSGEGEVRSCVPRRRLETRAGEVSKGVTVADTDVQALAAHTISSLPGAYGVLNVQIFKDLESGRLHVIEVNARFGGGFPLSWESGARMPSWLLQEAEGIAPIVPLDWTPGKLMLRYDTAVFLDTDEGVW